MSIDKKDDKFYCKIDPSNDIQTAFEYHSNARNQVKENFAI